MSLNVGVRTKVKNKLINIADKFNHSPVWNHTMLFFLLYAYEMLWFVVIFIYRYLFAGFIGEALKAWLFMTVPLILGWLLLGLRNYYINKKIGIWKHYQSKTRNGKLID